MPILNIDDIKKRFRSLGFLLLVLLIPVLQAQEVTHLPAYFQAQHKTKIKLGIDVLSASNFELLKGKRVGLITNPTGVNKELKSTLDILFEAKNVNLVALFGPEHGVRGNADAGKPVGFSRDQKTGLPVYSLYGKTRKPTKAMLEGIDILVYDIQDIGVRSYTFISTLGLAMEAASENNIDFMVLDRPNPLGGNKIEGLLVDPENISFISQYPIPYVYGLTCGELATLLVKEHMISTKTGFKLNVVPMQGWYRNMYFEATGLAWVPSSPHIPNAQSAYYYPMTGLLGELRSALSIGVGYTLPFQLVGAEWIDGDELADELNAMDISGLYFRPITYSPYYAFGKGKSLQGVQIYITDFSALNLIATQFQIMFALKKLYPEKDLFKLASPAEINMFIKASGSRKFFKLLTQSNQVDTVLNFLKKDVHQFRKMSKKYYLYQ